MSFARPKSADINNYVIMRTIGQGIELKKAHLVQLNWHEINKRIKWSQSNF
jgi:hypothetical protein